MSYTVTVTREAGYWLAEVTDLSSGAHTEARTLGGLDTAVREIIVLAEDLPDEAMADLDLAYEYRTGDERVDTEASELRRQRAHVAELDHEVTTRTETMARSLVSQGYSVRDAGILTGVSYQRVSQLTHKGRRARERQQLARPRGRGRVDA